MTRRKQHMGSHSRHSYSIFKRVPRFTRRHKEEGWDGYMYTVGDSSTQRQVIKRMHNRKIRKSRIDMEDE